MFFLVPFVGIFRFPAVSFRRGVGFVAPLHRPGNKKMAKVTWRHWICAVRHANTVNIRTETSVLNRCFQPGYRSNTLFCLCWGLIALEGTKISSSTQTCLRGDVFVPRRGRFWGEGWNNGYAAMPEKLQHDYLQFIWVDNQIQDVFLKTLSIISAVSEK